MPDDVIEEEKSSRSGRRSRRSKARVEAEEIKQQVAEEAKATEIKEEKIEEVKPPTKIKIGDFVLVDYTIKVKETGEIVDTTIEEVGKNYFETGKTYEPKLVIPGKGLLLKAIEDELLDLEPNQEKVFEIPPEKAFGPRDPSKVKVIPIRRLRDIEGPITVGSRITIDGREGVVRSIGSGRVQVDFNPYLAGKHLECWIRVVKIIEDKLEKIKSLIHTRIPDVDVNKFEILQDGGEVRITIPKEAFLLPALQLSKRVLAKDIIDHIEGVEKIVYLENYDRLMFQ
ncbi:MAG: peptidylprolyl isomerase [Thaumarchaeota archaeon]|jgi:peptidylprolyl isomerase|nr:peptidylprolyl isomerase [Candidatus Geocrenenecus arthurdayi]MCL7389189.1 peptidylprolyl isomerase [Candidatus Geocrenenecus arthurdayi]MCL7390494.1 peptidylprolyl isomerase [Candidatus Geocrenenecus arthurdayi]MCL7395985.1 peptidylprolyl isomerase [Candidatus Geocrenenecus arthurdayi]MCL7404142.1 peptidylprolyl isomerase [Candidatus Geocrenenecus arthurdayi]